jgi:MFS family permease
MLTEYTKYLLLFIVLLSWFAIPSYYGDFDSNETYVVVNTLSFGAQKSLEPSPYLAYGTAYSYLLLLIYLGIFVVGYLAGVYGDQFDFGMQFFVDPTIFYIAGRLVSALFAVGTLYLVYLVGKKFFQSKRIGFLAVLFLLLTKIFYIRSSLVLPDMMLAFLTILFIAIGLRILDKDIRSDYILAGIVAGLILGTKANGALTLAIFPLFALLNKTPENVFRKPFYINLFLFFLCFIASLFLVNPYLFLKFQNHFALILQEKKKAEYVIKNTSEIPYIWIFLRILKDNLYIGPILLAGFAFSLYHAIRRKRIHIILSTIVFIFIIFLGRQNIHNIHFALPIIPILCLMGAAISDHVLFSFKNDIQKYLSIGILVTLMVLSTWNLVMFNQHNREQVLQKKAAEEWIIKNIFPGTMIAVDSYENAPQIPSFNRYFSSERLQDYRIYVPSELKERTDQFAKKNETYRMIRVKFYHAEPKWPSSFDQEKKRKFEGDLFMEREYRLDWRTIEEVREKGAEFLIVTSPPKPEEEHIYPKEHFLYEAHRRMINFYESLNDDNGVIPVARFGTIEIYKLLPASLKVSKGA